MIKKMTGNEELVMFHTEGYKQSAILDWSNAYGHGVGAIINRGTLDRSQVIVLGRDLKSFLE